MDLTESSKSMQIRIASERVEHIGKGPYFGGFHQPTMLDFAVYAQPVFGYLFGLEEQLSASMNSVLKALIVRVAAHLPDNPTLAADAMQINKIVDGVGVDGTHAER